LMKERERGWWCRRSTERRSLPSYPFRDKEGRLLHPSLRFHPADGRGASDVRGSRSLPSHPTDGRVRLDCHPTGCYSFFILPLNGRMLLRVSLSFPVDRSPSHYLPS
jgi:hypothetical protein